ncbi:MAG: Do family serine endopeptidase [Odoribacter sp.]|nr:Do family serine endopeptidase [Odoribacter sp.]
MKKFIILAVTAAYAVSLSAHSSAPISQDDFINAAQSTVNGVVSVKSYATVRTRDNSRQGYDPFLNDPFFQYFFGVPQQRQRGDGDSPNGRPRQPQAQQRQVGLGSGVIISADGLIVTNNHVIDGAERLEVTLNDNRNFTATIVGADPVTDLALIKIDAPGALHVIPMGNSEDLQVGEWVLAVGNPFGFTSTVTSGIVSAKARNISTTTGAGTGAGIEAYIQTDAAVNSGNSGGALVNLDGELVGINTAIYSSTGTYAGCSFAIPTSIVQKVVSDLQQYGNVQRAFLGIMYRELTPELITELGITGATRGVYINEVQDHSAAFEAGLSHGDILTHINGIEVTGTARLQEIMARCSPGDVITIAYVRDGNQASATVTLRNRDGNTALSAPETPMGVLGATFTSAGPEVLQQLEISRGVAVTITGEGRFADAGIRDGFIITSINNMRVASPDDVEKIYNSVRNLGPGDDKVLFISGIYPTGKRAHYAVGLD